MSYGLWIVVDGAKRSQIYFFDLRQNKTSYLKLKQNNSKTVLNTTFVFKKRSINNNKNESCPKSIKWWEDNNNTQVDFFFINISNRYRCVSDHFSFNN